LPTRILTVKMDVESQSTPLSVRADFARIDPSRGSQRPPIVRRRSERHLASSRSVSSRCGWRWATRAFMSLNERRSLWPLFGLAARARQSGKRCSRPIRTQADGAVRARRG